MSDYEIKYKLESLQRNVDQTNHKMSEIESNQMDSKFNFNLLIGCLFLIFWFLLLERLTEHKSNKKCEAEKISVKTS
jgi:hypothetical protein